MEKHTLYDGQFVDCKKNILKWHTLNLQISYTKITAEICTYYSCDGYINVVQRSCKCVRWTCQLRWKAISINLLDEHVSYDDKK